jgi:tight adherence protein C
MTAALALGWFTVVMAGGWRDRPLRRPTAVALPPRRRAPWSPSSRRLFAAGLATAALLPLIPVAAPVAGLVVWAAAVQRGRARARSRRDDVVGNLPEVVDLLGLAVSAGLTVPMAIDAAAHRGTGPVAAALADVVSAAALGRRCSDVLEELPARLGEAVRPLVGALVASDRYGAPLGEGLTRLAAEVRDDRRRRAEDAARRIPVKLLFPLVCCVLPAFALLTVAPLLAGALGSLRL